MKNIISFLLISISFILSAQNLESKIPDNAEIVITADGNRVLDLISVIDINNSFIGEGILKNANRSRKDTINSIEELGFNLKSRSYYFLETNDSINYNNFLTKILNRENFEKTLSKFDKEKVKTDGNINYIEDYNGIRIWNDNLFLLVNGMKSYVYFKNNKERFAKRAETEEELEYSIHKRIVKSWVKNHAFDIFKNNPNRSILSNNKFQSSKQKNAAGTLWVKNYGMIISQIMSTYSSMLSPSPIFTGKKNFYGFEEVIGNLFFEKDAVKLSLDMGVTPSMQKSFKKMYNKKIDKKFFNHFDQNKAMAFWSMSFDTKAVFEEYPNIMNTMYGGMLPSAKEEIEAAMDLFSLLLDEEAIAELMTGDMLFILDDLAEKEVEYVTYEYDEDYNSKEIKKTKKEAIPDFTLMIGSKKRKFLEKLYRLGMKHKVLNANAGIFEFVMPKKDFPFDMYSVIKDDILFLSTSKEKVSNISNNRNYSKTKANQHTKLIKKNSSLLYVDMHKMLSKIPMNEFKGSDKKMITLMKDNFKDAYFKSSKLNGNKISSELKINISDNQENALRLLFKMMNEIGR